MPALLREHEDAYGRLMLDYLEGRPTEEIVERDDGYIYLGAGPGLYFAQYLKWRSHERQSMRYVRGDILDVGCGAGRALLHLRDRGFRAVGIDSSPLAIEVCRRRGLGEVHARSINELEGLGVFDTILLLGSGVGSFGKRSKARRLLGRMRSITRDHASIIATTRDPYDDPSDRAYTERNISRGRMGGQFRIRIRYRIYRTPWWDYLTVSQHELSELVEGTGWEIARLIPGPDGRYAAILQKG